MSDRKALAREIAARTTAPFIEIKKEKREWRPNVDDKAPCERAKAARRQFPVLDLMKRAPTEAGALVQFRRLFRTRSQD